MPRRFYTDEDVRPLVEAIRPFLWRYGDDARALRDALATFGNVGVPLEEAVRRGARVLYEEARAGAMHLESERALQPEARRMLLEAVARTQETPA